MGDSVMYMQKAKVFWEMLASGNWKNPLNLEPIIRPPGTILMSYPFGFTGDFKGYLARSVILPILGFVAALYVAASRRTMSLAEHLDLAAVALILATLPCFYDANFRGLVDTFFAAVTAFALGIGYRSVKQRSWSLLVLASFTIGFCLMIKPAGTIVAVIIIGVLTALMAAEELLASANTLSWARALRFIFSFRMLCFLVTLSLGTALFFMASFNSGYLSHDTIQWGKTTLNVMHDRFNSLPSVENLKNVLYPSFGLNVFVLSLISVVAVIRVAEEVIREGASRLTLFGKLLNPILAVVVVTVGAFFWLGYTILSDVRYFYPFAFLSLILIAIFLLEAIRGKAAPYTRLLIYGSGVILFGSLTLMLYFPKIDPSWKRKFGVTLDLSTGHEGRRLADLLIRRAGGEERDLKVYCLEPTGDFATMMYWGMTEKVLYPTEPAFSTKGPLDWVHAPVVHMEDLFLSDCILYNPVGDEVKWNVAPGLKFDDLRKEVETISSWLTAANDEFGLKDLALGKIAIKEVVNRKLFAQSFAKWAASKNWRDLFKSENSDYLPNSVSAKWPGEKTQSTAGKSTETFEQVIAVDDVQVETFSPLMFRVDWHTLAENLPDNLYFFVHVMDNRGNLLANCAFNLNSRLWADPTPLVLRHTLVPTNIHVNSGTLRYGFGIFEGTHAEKLLMPNPAGNDFAGKRVVRELQVR
jgi:hypothetical protein